MTTTTKYFHDRLILLLLSVNVFLAMTASIFVLLRLSSNHGNGYIVQYRPGLGIDAFKQGSVSELISFVGFAVLVVAVHAALSWRAYRINRQLAVTVLALGILLLLLTLIVSNALLILR